MRPCSTALADFLNDAHGSREAIITDLYTFKTTDGTILRYSGWTQQVTVPNASFPTISLLNTGADRTFLLGPRFGRSKAATQIGVAPTELDLDVFAGVNDLVGTFPFADAVRIGLFDGATLELDRLFSAPQPGTGNIDATVLGCLVWFYGRVADCEVGRTKIQMKVKSLLDLLAIHQFPRRLYQSGCTHIFGDTMCGYDREAGTAADGTAAIPPVTLGALDGSTQTEILTGYTGFEPADSYIEGTLVGIDGANVGVRRTIHNMIDGIVYFKKALLYAVTPGDSFKLLPGCAHTTGACDARKNLARHGGFPYIPPPESAV